MVKGLSQKSQISMEKLLETHG